MGDSHSVNTVVNTPHALGAIIIRPAG